MIKEKSDESNKQDYLSANKDEVTGGVDKLRDAELEYLRQQDQNIDKAALTGLALSGGGIRSAIFALGVMQRLARADWMEKIHYLSTVSGGGYMGASLTWFLQSDNSTTTQTASGTSVDGFPFGTHRRGKIDPATNREEPGGSAEKSSRLQALRQNGRYLTPGNGITLFSLLGVFLRGTFLSIVVYFPLLLLFFLTLYSTWLLRPAKDYSVALQEFTRLDIPALESSLQLNLLLVLALAVICSSILGAIFYAFHTYHPITFKTRRYLGRRLFDKASGKVINVLLVLFFLGSIPYCHAWLDPGSAGMNENESVSKSALMATSSMIFGFITTIITFITSSSLKEKLQVGKRSSLKPLLLSVLTFLAIFSLFYGVMLLAYAFVLRLMLFDSMGQWVFYGIWLVIALLTGRYVNINYVSVHRFYRDRLMETFMPNIKIVDDDEHRNRERMADADRFKLSSITPLTRFAPYHIINTNIVLVESHDKKLRARGGDSFILSPLFCGSSATGWSCTGKFMNNEMTLATAMAISGAAANPDTGIGGEGPTRNRGLSLLMSLLNIRLGYWAPHPDPKIHQRENKPSSKGDLKSINPLSGFRPNFFHPMLTSTAFGGFMKKRFKSHGKKTTSGSYFGKNENSHFVELTDGGHFENLGLYELVRRQLKTIIVCDGGADPGFDFSDLANAIEKVRVDFGVVIDLDITPLIPINNKQFDDISCAETGFVLGDIHYPDNTKGRLVYIKTTFVKNIYPDLLCYKKLNPLFPDQPTSDQFFDEKQFEAYRGLGNFIGKQLTANYTINDSADIVVKTK